MTAKKKAKKFEECKTQEEQRCWLAQDVIDSIKAKKLALFSGQYLKLTPHMSEYADGEELRDILREKQTPCQGCAVGSLFLRAVDAHDKLKVEDVGKGLEEHNSCTNTLVPYLNQWFSSGQLALIEAAFEAQFFGMFMVDQNDAGGYSQVEAAIKFGLKRGENAAHKKNARVYERRMVAVMRNIIKHNGTFKPKED